MDRAEKRATGRLLLTVVLIVAVACGSEAREAPEDASPEQESGEGVGDVRAPSPGPPPNPLPLTEVKTWAYQLQGISEPGAVDALAASAYDMLVLEPTRTDWSSDDRFFDTRSMMSRLKASPGRDGVHRKVVLAYVNIAEAEDWRWYWAWSQDWNCRGAPPTDWPEYILACDPDGWEGNYPVAYWDRNWKDVLIYGSGSAAGPGRDYRSVMDEVILDGFDGIYLDWVEAFEDPVVVTAAEAAGLDPAQEMIALIDELGTYARERRPGFVILQQNGVTLVEGNPELMGLIDGIAQEAIWYDGRATDDWRDGDGYDWEQEEELTSYYLGYLRVYLDAGLPVFSCEYALAHAERAYELSHAAGLIPYVTRASLARLTTTPPWDE